MPSEICTCCKKIPPVPGKFTCYDCLQYKKQGMAKTRKDLEALGICTRCYKNQAAEGKVTCQPCLDDYRTGGKTYERRKDRAFQRTGRRTVLTEWRMKEVEAAQKWAKEHPILTGAII